jgi:lipid-binding SYLF domain-containing protein
MTLPKPPEAPVNSTVCPAKILMPRNHRSGTGKAEQPKTARAFYGALGAGCSMASGHFALCPRAALPEETVAEVVCMRHRFEMKLRIMGLLLVALAFSGLANDRADLDNRIRKLTLKFDALQSKPDKKIPVERLREAKGIILLDRTKAGFLFAYQGGGGLIMLKDAKTDHWSPPAFLSANEASLGFQIGGEQSFVVILLMNTNAVQAVAQGTFKFGGDASGTAGNSSAGTEATVSEHEPLTFVYTDSEGLYGGATIKGDSITPDTNADIAYYGQYLTMREILFDNKVKLSPPATDLANKIESYSK